MTHALAKLGQGVYLLACALPPSAPSLPHTASLRSLPPAYCFPPPPSLPQGLAAGGKLGTLKNDALKDICAARGLPKSGNKAELVARIEADLAKKGGQ